MNTEGLNEISGMFSSPFIEERLYFMEIVKTETVRCKFSSPFIEERLYFDKQTNRNNFDKVLVPFYRGAVVFNDGRLCCIINKNVLVPFYRGAVVFTNN